MQTFQSTCSGDESFYGPADVFNALPFGEGLVIESDRSGPTYDIDVPQLAYAQPFSVAFTQADRDSSVTSAERYIKTDANGRPQRFTTFAPVVDGTPLEYTRQMQLIAITESGLTSVFCAFGVPTVTSDVPSATKSYTKSSVTGVMKLVEDAYTTTGAIRQYSPFASTASATADPATGQIRITFHLRGQEIVSGSTSATVVDFGTYTATTTIDGSEQSFGGIATNSANVVSGTFGGWFFGPQGKTMAVAFTVKEYRSDDTEVRFGGLIYLN